MMFIKFVLTLCVTAFVVGSINAQNSKPQLLGKFSDGDILEFNYRIANRLALSGEKTRVILRICSSDDILSAIALSAGVGMTANEEIGIASGLKRYHYKGDVFYAVYSGCESRNDRFYTVEYWLVKNGAKLDVDAEIRVDDVLFEITRPTSEREFVSILEDLKASTDDCDGTVKLIIGDYNSTPSAKMRRNVEKAEMFLGSNSKWETWRSVLVKATDIYDNEPEDDFPAFVSVSRKSTE